MNKGDEFLGLRKQSLGQRVGREAHAGRGGDVNRRVGGIGTLDESETGLAHGCKVGDGERRRVEDHAHDLETGMV